mmetsp:Transcript_22227/g.61886  ORF Transcript_22227/g.61886 Transcript_22227/m.61886 type:complete len:377 (+) Transcript_22227:900-2030(+)
MKWRVREQKDGQGRFRNETGNGSESVLRGGSAVPEKLCCSFVLLFIWFPFLSFPFVPFRLCSFLFRCVSFRLCSFFSSPRIVKAQPAQNDGKATQHEPRIGTNPRLPESRSGVIVDVIVDVDVIVIVGVGVDRPPEVVHQQGQYPHQHDSKLLPDVPGHGRCELRRPNVEDPGNQYQDHQSEFVPGVVPRCVRVEFVRKPNRDDGQAKDQSEESLHAQEEGGRKVRLLQKDLLREVLEDRKDALAENQDVADQEIVGFVRCCVVVVVVVLVLAVPLGLQELGASHQQNAHRDDRHPGPPLLGNGPLAQDPRRDRAEHQFEAGDQNLGRRRRDVDQAGPPQGRIAEIEHPGDDRPEVPRNGVDPGHGGLGFLGESGL